MREFVIFLESMETPSVFRWTEESLDGKKTLHESTNPADSYLDGLILRHSRPFYVDWTTEEPSPIVLSEEDKENIKNKNSHENTDKVIEITTPHPSQQSLVASFLPPVIGSSSSNDPGPEQWTENAQRQFVTKLGESIPLCCALVDEVTMLIAFMMENMKKLAIQDSSSQFHLTMHRAMTQYLRAFSTVETGVESLKDLNTQLFRYQAAGNDLEKEFSAIAKYPQNALKTPVVDQRVLDRIGYLVKELEEIEDSFKRIDFSTGLKKLTTEIAAATERENVFVGVF